MICICRACHHFLRYECAISAKPTVLVACLLTGNPPHLPAWPLAVPQSRVPYRNRSQRGGGRGRLLSMLHHSLWRAPPPTAPSMTRSSSSCHFYFQHPGQSPPSFLYLCPRQCLHSLIGRVYVHTYVLRILATTIHAYHTNHILLLNNYANRVSRRQPRPLVSPARFNRFIAWLAVQAGGTRDVIVSTKPALQSAQH